MIGKLWVHAPFFWHLVTRLGEAQILMPAALLALMGLLRRHESRSQALAWAAGLAMGVLITTASKVAFIGWGLGWAAINFTGFSGHAMFSAAVYPLLGLSVGLSLGPPVPSRVRWWPLAAGVALAVLVGVSRVMVGAHSVSEVVAGLALGGGVSLVAGGLIRLPRMPVQPLVPAVLVLWLALMPWHAPPSVTHEMVIRLSLKLSGHPQPYTRDAMLRAYQLRQRQAEQSA